MYLKTNLALLVNNNLNMYIRQLGMDESTYLNEIRKAVLREQITAPFNNGNDLSLFLIIFIMT